MIVIGYQSELVVESVISLTLLSTQQVRGEQADQLADLQSTLGSKQNQVEEVSASDYIFAISCTDLEHLAAFKYYCPTAGKAAS